MPEEGGRNAHHADHSRVHRPLLHRNVVSHNNVRSGQNPSAPCSSDSPAGYEDLGVGCKAAYQASEFKDQKSTQEGPFDIQHAVYASVCWQEGTSRDEVCTCIPTDVIVGVKLVCDMRDSLALSKDGVSKVRGTGNGVAGLLS